MQHRAIAGDVLARAHPAVAVQAFDRHFDVAIVEDATRRHFLRRDPDDQVRLAIRPLGRRPCQLGERIHGVVLLRARFNPVDQRLLLLRAQRERLLEVADVRIDLARRHAFREHHFADHRCEALNDRMAVHCEGRDAAFAMAARAVLGQDRRDSFE